MASYSFSGCDFKCLAFPYGNADAVELTTLVTVSFSTVHSKSPARTLSRNYPAGYTNTISEIRGTMIFNRHEERPLNGIAGASRYHFKDEIKRASRFNPLNILGGELDPFDLELIAVTEAGEALNGALSELNMMRLYGIEIIGSGEVISVHNTLTEKTYSFVARGFRELERFHSTPFKTTEEIRSRAIELARRGVVNEDVIDPYTLRVKV